MTTQSKDDTATIHVELDLSAEAADYLLFVITEKFRVRGGLLVPAMTQMQEALGVAAAKQS